MSLQPEFGRSASVELTMTKFDGTDPIDLGPLFIQISFMESITSPELRGSIVIQDSVGLFQDYFQGEERINLKLATSNRTPIDLDFYVYAAQQMKTNDQLTTYTYSLDIVSLESYNALVSSVSRYFKDNISDVAKGVYSEEFNSTLPLQTSPTTGTNEFIVPGHDLYGTMAFLARRAFNSEFQPSMFSFFQTNKGYYFYNISQMIKEKREAPRFVYQYRPDTLVDPDLSTFFNMHLFEVDKIGNTLDDLKSGSYFSSVLDYDLTTGRFITRDSKDVIDTIEFMDPSAVQIGSAAFKKEFIEDESHATFVKTYDSDREDHLSEMYGPRILNLSLLGEINARATIWGNVDLEAGDLFTVDVDAAVGVSDKSRKQNKMNGNYLISTITHIITTQEYKMNLGLLKDSFNGSL